MYRESERQRQKRERERERETNRAGVTIVSSHDALQNFNPNVRDPEPALRNQAIQHNQHERRDQGCSVRCSGRFCVGNALPQSNMEAEKSPSYKTTVLYIAPFVNLGKCI